MLKIQENSKNWFLAHKMYTCCIYVFSKRLKTLIWIHIHPRHTWRFFSSSLLLPFSHFQVFCQLCRFQWSKCRRRTTKVLLSKRHGLSSCNASLEGIFRQNDGHNPNIGEDSKICLQFFPEVPDFFLKIKTKLKRFFFKSKRSKQTFTNFFAILKYLNFR